MNLFDEDKAVRDCFATYVDLDPKDVAELVKEIHVRYHPFKKLQRALALSIFTVYMLAWLVVFILKIRFPDYPVPIEMFNGPLGIAFAAVTGLYFAGGTLNKK